MAYVDLTQNIVAQYKMNDNVGNSVVVNAQGDNASYVGGATTADKSVDGKVNNALNFNSVLDYIDTGQTFNTTFQKDFSVNLWVKIEDISGILHYVPQYFFSNAQTDTSSLRSYITSTTIRFSYDTPTMPGFVIEHSHNLADDTWNMLTFTAKNNTTTMTMEIFANGVSLGSTTDTADMASFSAGFPLLIGASHLFFPSGEMKGDMDNVAIFDKVLSQDEIYFLYNNGFGTEGLVGTTSFDENTSPTLIYPVGGEKLTHETIQIQWDEPLVLAFRNHNKAIWYEIFYSIDTASEDNRIWNKIADVPIGNSVFNWKIPHKIRSNRCRVGIRTVDSEGTRTPIIMSSDVFSIQNRILPSPSVFSPLSDSRFFTYIPVVFDQGGLEGQFPTRAHYRVSYASSNQEIDWTCIGDNIPISTSEMFLDVSKLVSDDDYSLKFELIDGEDSSQPVFVNNVTINNLNFFKIDTVPPSGTIKVRNNSEYINNRDAILELSAYDKTSGTESFQIIQKELDYFIDDKNVTTEGPLTPMSGISSWRIVERDGVKLVQVSFVDFAGNQLESESDKFFFRTYKSVDNREVTAIFVNKNGDTYDVWQAVGGVDPELYLNGSSVVGTEATGTLNYLPTSSTSHGLSIQRYDVEGLGSIDVHFFAYEIPDRLVIEAGGNVLKDTGLMSGQTSFNLSVVGLSEIIVKVTSQNAGTLWAYEIDSKDEYPITSDFYDTAASKDKPAGEILSMAIYNEVLYLGEETKEAIGLLQRYTGGHIESVYEISDTDGTPSVDSAINSMVVFNGKLFLALQNGELHSFDGTTVNLEETFDLALNKVGTDGNLLYIYLKNSSDIYTAYKDIFGELVYVKTTLE